MKLGLFWLGRASSEIEVVTQTFSDSFDKNPFSSIELFYTIPHKSTNFFERKTKLYKYNTINDLNDVFYHCHNVGIDFAVISFGNGFPLSLDLLYFFLSSEPIQKSVWSFRICKITGKSFRHSPRFPLVDDHFIVLNVQRALEVGFFSRKLVNASHSSQSGGRRAHLLSMIEFSVNKEELNNHFFPDKSMNLYGEISSFNSMPFHLCEATGFLSVYSDFKLALFELLKKNLEEQCNVQHSSSVRRIRFFQRNSFWYLRPFFNFQPVMNLIKRLFNTDSLCFQKKYDDTV